MHAVMPVWFAAAPAGQNAQGPCRPLTFEALPSCTLVRKQGRGQNDGVPSSRGSWLPLTLPPRICLAGSTRIRPDSWCCCTRQSYNSSIATRERQSIKGNHAAYISVEKLSRNADAH